MKRPTDVPTGAAAPAGGEALPPEPATEPAAAPVDLPKALSDQEREYVGHHALAAGKRALAWIDGATSLLAQQAAQIVTDGQRIAALEARLLAHEAGVFQHAGQRIAELEAVNERLTRALVAEEASFTEMRGAFDARVRELQVAVVSRHEAPAYLAQRSRADWAEQKLAAANALLSDALDALNQDAWTVLADGIRAHLAGQPAAPVLNAVTFTELLKPAAPSRTEAERSVLSAIDAAPERVVREWVKAPAGIVGFYHDLGVAELARRGLK